ncbi:MAG: hypothetical protein A2281_11165 [Bacteroidetes bacterium RIFOXYA12_FULL_38_20]|uniref:Aminopeptidase N n=1 Tax=Candidatus Uhrbacteria bacterium GW2011_GWF2_44_350 TaxID=1619000 RepID=A0A0G1JL50_9BACT|nr:MAG: Aminopeptidase N [Candidatus Uhrbacteria bacterium GW2011_GWF2_44_350]OFY78675.1 MAG: hypothetical protein A2281_11165 [Bacteroidetes bacterium RIFOXYA12_FULL_38_20]
MKKIFLILAASLLVSTGYSQTKSLHSDSLDVLNYTIVQDMRVLSSSFQLNGHATLTIQPKVNNLDIVSLDLLKLVVDSIYFGPIEAPGFTYNDTLLNIQTPELFMTTDIFTVTVYYHGHPVIDPSGWGGFYCNSNYAFNLGVAFADNPHSYGRAWYPCIDDFIDRATYDLYVTATDPKIVIGGGHLQSAVSNGDGTTTYHWVIDDEIPSYLSSVAVGRYAHVAGTYNGLLGPIPTDIFVYPADSMDAVNSFVNLNETMAAFENYFGPYRWDRVGYVGTSQGAMEHATNIAMPYQCIDGTLNYETLYAHELAHHWFGDLFTCETAFDMWINEGGATYAEFIFEEGVYGKTAAKNYIRNMHKEVLRYSHIEDGFIAIYGIPHEQTYCNTVYDKGGLVWHSLRGYLGDDLFFNALKEVNSVLGFSDVSTVELRDFMSAYTGVDLTGFFDAWVFNPGHIHFSVDSFNVLSSESPFNVEVFMRQKTKGPATLGNSNKVEVTFMNDQWEEYTAVVEFDGETGSQIVELPFYPKIAMCDKEEKLCDATTDLYKTLKTTGTIDYPLTFAKIDVTSITDSAFIRVEHNWVVPDPIEPEIPGMFISDYRYWKIDGILPEGFDGFARFYFNKTTSATGYLDNTFMTNSADSLVLLYRQGPGYSWDTISFTKSSGSLYGYLISDTLMLGEYALGIWNWDQWMGAYNFEKKDDFMKVYPNPSSGDFNIEFASETSGELFIYDLKGRILEKIKVVEGQNHIEWSPDTIEKGTYLVHFNDGKKGFVQKVVVE